MTLPKNHRAIIAGFRTPEIAEQAKEELAAMGIKEVTVEPISLFPLNANDTRVHNLITGDFPGLANAIFEQHMDRDASVLASAHPSASGMSDGNDELIGVNIILSAVVSNEQYAQAAEIVENLGGYF